MKGLLQGMSPEEAAKLGLFGALASWNIIEGAVFENEYPRTFIKLYPIAAWRLILLVALIAGAQWCPSVGLMMAFATFFYAMDMEITMDRWVPQPKYGTNR